MDRPTDKALEASEGKAAEQSTFDLHITFTGLCLFVDDLVRKDGAKLLHVLMPRTGGGGHGVPGHVHAHLARLLYDARHEKEGTVDDGTPRKHHATRIEMENRALDLSDVDTDAAFTPTLQAEMDRYSVFDLSTFVGSRSARPEIGQVPRPWLDEFETGGMVVSRVTVGKGAVSGGDSGVQWRIGDRAAQHMAVAVDWTIPNVKGSSLTLVFDGLNGNHPHSFNPLTLYPISYPSGPKKIHLWLVHSPDRQIPTKVPVERIPGPPEQKDALHFNAFYSLLGGPIPVYEGTDTGETAGGSGEHREHAEAGEAPADAELAAAGGSDASCIGPRATAVPQT
ncbi:MAG TPA: hypothetical protein VGB24_04750 [Longimicrobium sp.]|jgi:hypothetical protein|uniref:hypothetical protein n=1 Tax=Longimicrobium sp. TaxID=2029185 RepID=UPI002ED7B3FC